MDKQKFIKVLRKHFNESGWCLDDPGMQDCVIEEIETDLDKLIKCSKNCGCLSESEPINLASML